MKVKVSKSKQDYEISLYKLINQRILDTSRILQLVTQNQSLAHNLTEEAIQREIDWCTSQKNLIFEQYQEVLGKVEQEKSIEQKETTQDIQSNSHTPQSIVEAVEEITDNSRQEVEQIEIKTNLEDIQQNKIEPAEEIKVSQEPEQQVEQVEEDLDKLREEVVVIENQIQELQSKFEEAEKSIEKAAEVDKDLQRMRNMSWLINFIQKTRVESQKSIIYQVAAILSTQNQSFNKSFIISCYTSGSILEVSTLKIIYDEQLIV